LKAESVKIFTRRITSANKSEIIVIIYDIIFKNKLRRSTMSNKQITFKELLKPVNSNDVKISEKINKTNRKNASKDQ